MICSVCHQPILPQYYFCPNCGTKINSAPLSTSVRTQAWVYAFSIALPMIAFLFVTRWPGMKYYKSLDPKTKRIGQIAWALLIISTIVTIWLVYTWTQSMIQSSINSINTDFGGL
ncbi:MAG: zinc ribbon domain-containing protein [Patescibacteria group bacterium]|nr:zinc ribbon domain-containing protein [Patescibacteria group bacterium]